MKAVIRKPYVIERIARCFPEVAISTTFCDGDILICDPQEMTRNHLEMMPSLRWIQGARAGYDGADLADIQKRGISLTTAGDTYSSAIAEDIINKMLIGSCHSIAYMEHQRCHQYDKITNRRLLEGQTIGFIGTGSIAKATAKRLRPFGVNLIGYCRTKRDIAVFDELYTGASFAQFLGKCDILVLSTSLNETTYHMINEESLAFCKWGFMLINISRGEVVDELALLEALRIGRITFAGLDVFEQEPLPKDSMFYEMPNVFLTPHVAGISNTQHERFAEVAVDNMLRFLENKALLHQVI